MTKSANNNTMPQILGAPRHVNDALSLLWAHPFHKKISYHLCAVVVRGGNILSVGFNDYMGCGDYGLQKRHKPHNQHIESVHAEINAILAIRRKVDLTDAKIFVARLLRGNRIPDMAKPCPMCQNVLAAHGFKRAWFTTGDPDQPVGMMKF